jgi:hypothetical protein
LNAERAAFKSQSNQAHDDVQLSEQKPRNDMKLDAVSANEGQQRRGKTSISGRWSSARHQATTKNETPVNHRLDAQSVHCAVNGDTSHPFCV